MTDQQLVPLSDSGPTTDSESTKAVPEQSSPTSAKTPYLPVDRAVSPKTHAEVVKPDSKEAIPEAPISPASVSSNKVESRSQDRDLALANVAKEKTHSHIRAWEENEKAKSFNKFDKVVAKINAWENAKKAKVEAHLKTAEEELEKKRAALVEKMKNEIAAAHKAAEEKKANAEAKKREEILKAEELAEKFKASGKHPKKFLCFST